MLTFVCILTYPLAGGLCNAARRLITSPATPRRASRCVQRSALTLDGSSTRLCHLLVVLVQSCPFCVPWPDLDKGCWQHRRGPVGILQLELREERPWKVHHFLGNELQRCALPQRVSLYHELFKQFLIMRFPFGRKTNLKARGTEAGRKKEILL